MKKKTEEDLKVIKDTICRSDLNALIAKHNRMLAPECDPTPDFSYNVEHVELLYMMLNYSIRKSQWKKYEVIIHRVPGDEVIASAHGMARAMCFALLKLYGYQIIEVD